MTLELNTVHQGNCYTLMDQIETASIQAVITDLPYHTTSCSWDKQPIDIPALWERVKRVLKPGGIFVTTTAQPFTTELILSNRKWFRYELVYKKSRATGFLDANKRPLKNHETILIFSDKRTSTVYNPQKTPGKPYKTLHRSMTEVYSKGKAQPTWTVNLTGDRHPLSVLEFDFEKDERGKHPTQKPLSLYRWLVRTYTNPGDLVLDPFAGSGTTGVACQESDRNYILIEREEKYAEAARLRLAQPATSSGPRFQVLPGGKAGKSASEAPGQLAA